ncbi:hypothetical protein MKW98_025358 [Papaver atlanticum]|uniref:Uncharacterized protein n=1 Tax=Papaver atlanticum TaxID=357466 RepID=A0AAD4S2G0_9MAGN|nr:hypothetical protein MKW98_025358 [Papaver atlanticum]
MSSSTTQLVVALSLLCLILLGFSYSAEAAARPITNDAGAAENHRQCEPIGVSCHNDDDCHKKCDPTVYFAGVCIGAAASSNREEKTDVNRLKVISQAGCCCFSIYR